MNPWKAAELVKEMGPAWVFWRGLYEIQQRTGILRRRFPTADVDSLVARSLGVDVADVDDSLVNKWRDSPSSFFLSSPIRTFGSLVSEPERVVGIADTVLEGRLLCFSKWWADVGNPPDWFMNPDKGTRYPDKVHWSDIPDLSAETGDIKYVWEASRFPQVYYFVRAYAVTGDERYAEGFWNHVEAWTQANPVEMGPNWRCGQEIAIRSFAWIFGLYAFRDSPATTPQRIALLIKHLWYNAFHVERNHWYALRCVRNNHSLSEALGMLTIGTLFPFFRESQRWCRKGFDNLTREMLWQVYPDGTYIQHSMNYSRLVVQLFTWALRIGQINGLCFPEVVCERLGQLLRFLISVQDRETGRLPNYGSNDGALIFPLSSCDYLDYRPSLNALSVALGHGELYGSGPWNEQAFWFHGQPSGKSDAAVEHNHVMDKPSHLCTKVTDAPSSTGSCFPVGGYYVFRGNDTMAMIRCGRYLHRPSQADMLHFDLWYKGHNVLMDPGSYSYNPGQDWAKYFGGTSSHNTVTVDGQDQMTKGTRFLWSNWVEGRTLEFRNTSSLGTFVGQHEAYRLVIHQRLIIRKDDMFLIIDDLFGDELHHRYRLHWLFGDVPLTRNSYGATVCLQDDYLTLRTGCTYEANSSWAKGQENPKRGWYSLYYGEKLPAWSYEMTAEANGPVRFFTLISPGGRHTEPLTTAEVDDLLASWGAGRLGAIGAGLLE